jgi:hypothetical protein
MCKINDYDVYSNSKSEEIYNDNYRKMIEMENRYLDPDDYNYICDEEDYFDYKADRDYEYNRDIDLEN